MTIHAIRPCVILGCNPTNLIIAGDKQGMKSLCSFAGYRRIKTEVAGYQR